MPLSQSDRVKLKTHIDGNATQIDIGGVMTNIQNVPNTLDHNTEIAKWYNLPSSPTYWMWRTVVTRAEIYHVVSPDNTIWNWDTYKAQVEREQGAWTQMFMGDAAPAYLLNFRDGVFRIFSGSAPQNSQRAHILSCLRRNARNVERVIAVAVASVGGITPSVDNGNTLAQALGSILNPAYVGADVQTNAAEVTLARSGL